LKYEAHWYLFPSLRFELPIQQGLAGALGTKEKIPMTRTERVNPFY